MRVANKVHFQARTKRTGIFSIFNQLTIIDSATIPACLSI